MASMLDISAQCTYSSVGSLYALPYKVMHLTTHTTSVLASEPSKMIQFCFFHKVFISLLISSSVLYLEINSQTQPDDCLSSLGKARVSDIVILKLILLLGI